MSRPTTIARSRWAALLAAAALAALAGCGRQGEPGGPAVSREETRDGRRYLLRSSVEPRRVTLGDRAVWHLSAELPAGSRPRPILRDPADSSLDVSEVKPARSFRREAGARWSCALETRGFALGALPLPRVRLPVEVAPGMDTLEFPLDTLYVDSLTQAMSDSLEPDRGPLTTELRPVDIAVTISAALLAAALVAAAIIALRNARRHRRGPETAAGRAGPPEAPEERLRRELENLRLELTALRRDRFYERLSLALRSYTVAVTGIPALDLTTRELGAELTKRGGTDPEGAALLLRTLRRSDLAKFARREDSLEEARAALEEAVSLSGRLILVTAEAPQTPHAEVPPPPLAEGPPPLDPAGSGVR